MAKAAAKHLVETYPSPGSAPSIVCGFSRGDVTCEAAFVTCHDCLVVAADRWRHAAARERMRDECPPPQPDESLASWLMRWAAALDLGSTGPGSAALGRIHHLRLDHDRLIAEKARLESALAHAMRETLAMSAGANPFYALERAVTELVRAGARHRDGWRLGGQTTTGMLLHAASECHEIAEARTRDQMEQEFGDVLAILAHVALEENLTFRGAIERWLTKLSADFPGWAWCAGKIVAPPPGA